ncbi:glutathione S-transferase family protein [Pacificoceanicola onchidii]|uniref:glutathione S-transferase family protein n=1 Tax=Pacificoceanicola onchidii TaxID=2562685 RepID=UPI0010A34370|nr:glutathione S-transferase [Pacificoceanicola onchidii]
MTTPDITLYGSPESGHACKVALGLALCGVPHRTVHVDISLPRDQRQPEFQRISPLGEVPVLVMDGQVLFQSGAILMTLADRFAPLGHGLERGRSLLMWEANRIGLCLPQLKGGGLKPDVVDWLTARFEIDRDNFDRLLGDGPFFHGDTPGIGDCAIWGYVQWTEEAGMTPSPAMQGWISAMKALPQMRAPSDWFAG